MTLAALAVLVAVGAGVGFLGALLGVGGGLILVPVFHLFYGIPLPTAVGTSLLVICGTSVTGTAGYLSRGLVELDLVLTLGLGALVGALVSSRFAGHVPEATLALIFAGVLGWLALQLLLFRRKDGGEIDGPRSPRGTVWAHALSPVAGVTAGLLGVGGGIVQVPLLRLLVGLDMRRAVATSTVMVGMSASVAAFAYLGRGEVALPVVPAVLAGLLAGGALAPRAAARVPRRTLEISFSALLLWVAVRMVLR